MFRVLGLKGFGFEGFWVLVSGIGLKSFGFLFEGVLVWSCCDRCCVLMV